MRSKSVLFATTLALLLSTSFAFADEASRTYARTEKAGAAPKKAEPKPPPKAKKAKKAGPMQKEENRVDPCLVERGLPGCARATDN